MLLLYSKHVAGDGGQSTLPQEGWWGELRADCSEMPLSSNRPQMQSWNLAPESQKASNSFYPQDYTSRLWCCSLNRVVTLASLTPCSLYYNQPWVFLHLKTIHDIRLRFESRCLYLYSLSLNLFLTVRDPTTGLLTKQVKLELTVYVAFNPWSFCLCLPKLRPSTPGKIVLTDKQQLNW